MFLSSIYDLYQIPKRIVSLVPSQTELLYYLRLEEETIGITKFCIHPGTWFKTKTRVGGTKTLDLEKIRSLKPDLVIANIEENVKEQIEELALQYPVWLTNVNKFVDALQMINDIGQLTGKRAEATLLTGMIQESFAALSKQRSMYSQTTKLKTCYLIWKDPYLVAGGNTFINDMLERAGFENVFADKLRYPETTPGQLFNMNCQLVLLSSEPYPFKQEHIHELQPLLPHCKIRLVDGEMFSWYGSRLLLSPGYFEKLQTMIQMPE